MTSSGSGAQEHALLSCRPGANAYKKYASVHKFIPCVPVELVRYLGNVIRVGAMSTTKLATSERLMGVARIIPRHRNSKEKENREVPYTTYVVQVQHAVNAMNPNWDNKVAG